MKTETKKDVDCLEELFNYLVDQYSSFDPSFSDLKHIPDSGILMRRKKILTLEESQFLAVKEVIVYMKNNLGKRNGPINYSLNTLCDLEKRLSDFKKCHRKLKYANFI